MSRAIGLLLLTAAVCGCNPDDCYAIANEGSLGAFLVGGAGPAEAYRVCDTLPDSTVQPKALTANGGACAPTGNDDACLACVKASCCEAAVACVGEASCECLIACRTRAEPEALCVAEVCGEASLDTAYDSAASCVAHHCSAECPRLR